MQESVPIRVQDWRLAGLEPGRHRFRVDVGQAEPAAGWSAIVVRGINSGRVFLVTAGVHGDEYEGMEGIRGFVETLDVNTLNGTVVAIPVINEPAYQACIRRSPVDDLDLARSFPGSPEGTATQRIAHALQHHVLPQCDFYCDLHAAGIHFQIAPLSGYQLGTEAFNEVQRGACTAFDLPVIWGTSYLPGRSLSAARDAGVPAMYVEYRGGGGCPREDVDHCKAALRRVAGFLGMIDEPFPTKFSGLLVEDDSEESGHLQAQSVAGVDGFIRYNAALMDRVERGEAVADIVDMLGDVQQSITAQHTGRIVWMRKTRFVKTGESCLAVLATND